MIQDAFGAESGRLSAVAADLDDAAFACPTRCAPWTVAELVFHVAMTMRRRLIQASGAGRLALG